MTVTAINQSNGFKTEWFTESHNFISDEPKSSGGGGEGPGPFELLAAALANCTAMTIRSYANIKGFDVQEIKVTVDAHRRSPDELKAADNDKPAVAVKSIELTGDLDDATRERILAVAEKCPVNKALIQGVDVTRQDA